MKTHHVFEHCVPGENTTLTVAGLKELLNHYPGEMPVLATWEGIYTLFKGLAHYDPRNKETYDYARVEDASPWGNKHDVPCLVFDVDQ